MTAWEQLAQNTTETCNVYGLGWRDGGGCGKTAAYQLPLTEENTIIASGCNPHLIVLRHCLEHHRAFLKEQEKLGKVEWVEEHLPDGTIRFTRKDRRTE